ncbi:hypothetical protein J2W36_001331 [Variovorax ginsengisoli]|uniref:Catalase-peroxidase n=1 Tax=Variovorax ginsengisoli TaxID=363844 RepID=A0ABT9S5R2_9BURK|nr:hypothetical protein [Variovorax ginsengisoli]
MTTEAKRPFHQQASGARTQNGDWWPKQLRLE